MTRKVSKAIFFIFVLALVALVISCKKDVPMQEETINATIEIEKTDEDEKISTQTGEYEKTDYYFLLPSLDNKEIDLKDYKNRPVLIMYFSSGCDVCKIAVPMLERINEKYKNLSLVTLTAANTNIPEIAYPFVKETGLTLPVILDDMSIHYFYGVRGLPHFFLLDKNHNLCKEWVGYHPAMEETLSTEIEKIL